jgi:hypothetical protein
MKDLEPVLLSIGTSFLKRALEPAYDDLAWHRTMQEIRSRPVEERLAIETALYAIAGLIEVRMEEHSAARKILKSLLTDGASEIGSRIMNNPLEKTDTPHESKLFFPPRIEWLDRITSHLEEPLF